MLSVSLSLTGLDYASRESNFTSVPPLPLRVCSAVVTTRAAPAPCLFLSLTRCGLRCNCSLYRCMLFCLASRYFAASSTFPMITFMRRRRSSFSASTFYSYAILFRFSLSFLSLSACVSDFGKDPSSSPFCIALKSSNTGTCLFRNSNFFSFVYSGCARVLMTFSPSSDFLKCLEKSIGCYYASS